jgi:hypothetical protein
MHRTGKVYALHKGNPSTSPTAGWVSHLALAHLDQLCQPSLELFRGLNHILNLKKPVVWKRFTSARQGARTSPMHGNR